MSEYIDQLFDNLRRDPFASDPTASTTFELQAQDATEPTAPVGWIAEGVIDDAQLVAGTTLVDKVTSLPTLPDTTNYPEGKVVYLTTDQKLYRSTGSTWTSAIPSADITGTITETQIANDSITTPKIAANAVVASKIAANTITSSQIAANTITAGQIAASTITATEIASSAITTDKINANAVTAAKIAANTITAGQIAAGTITATEIATGTITATKIQAGTITANEIANSTITGGKIAGTTITAANIVDATLTGAKLVDATITGAKIANATITSAKIANITTDQITGGANGLLIQASSTGVNSAFGGNDNALLFSGVTIGSVGITGVGDAALAAPNVVWLDNGGTIKDPATGTANKKGFMARGTDTANITAPKSIIGTTDVINSGSTVYISSAGVVANGGLTSNSTLTVNGTGKTTVSLPDTTTTTGITIGVDTNLYRSAANTLKTDDALTVTDTLTLSKTGKTALSIPDTTTTTGLTIGSDTNLYRNSASTLKTDSNFVVAGSLTVGTTIIYGVPAGSVQSYLGAYNNIPTGWLFCDGSAVSRSTYSALFAVIGTTFGAGDGSTTFTLPNLFGHMLVGGASTTTPGTASQTGSSDSYLNATWDHNHVHSHVTNPAATQSGGAVNGSPASGNTFANAGSGLSFQFHGHSTDIAATTSDTDSTTMSVAPTQKRTRVNYIIKY